MKKNVIVGCVALALCLVTSMAFAGDCKKIIANAGPSIYLEPYACSYDGVNYIWCIDTPLTGNLRGTWHLMSAPDWNIWELTVPEVLGIPGWDLWVGWSLMVIETHRGDIIAAENEVINLDAYNTYGALSGTASIVGGTGDFEGATGWFGIVVTEAEGGVMRGMVCTP